MQCYYFRLLAIAVLFSVRISPLTLGTDWIDASRYPIEGYNCYTKVWRRIIQGLLVEVSK